MRNVVGCKVAGCMGALVMLLSGCSSTSDGNASESAGGSRVSGGSSASGGVSAGGSVSVGGATATGGTAVSAGSGGMQATAGTQSTGGSSASAGTAGSGGTQVGPDPVILACDDIVAGTGWEKITPPGDLGDTQAIALDPLAVGTLYMQMHKGGNGGHYPTDGIYKTTDCGSTWNKIPEGRNARDDVEGEVNIHSGSIVSIIVDPVEAGVMYTASNYGPHGIFKSTNGGVDWDQLIPQELEQYMEYGGWFNALSVDPTDRLHLVGSTHTGCKGTYAPNCLAETRDGGDTWRLIHAPSTGNEQCGPYIHDGNTLLYVSGQNGAFLTTNDVPDSETPTWNQVGPGANGGDTGLFAYQASDGQYYLGTDYGVLIGSQDFTTWTLDDAAPHQLPFIVGTGTTMFASTHSADFYTTPESDGTTWTKLAPSGTAPTIAGRWLTYESTHKILYSSSWGDGLYRLATE